MKHVQQFHFTHSKNSAVVTSVLRNLPFNVLDINLAGSTVSQVNIGKSFSWKFLCEDRGGQRSELNRFRIWLHFQWISNVAFGATDFYSTGVSSRNIQQAREKLSYSHAEYE